MARVGLVGDIGGTNARFALVELDAPGRPVTRVVSRPAADHPTASEAIAAYLTGQGGARPVAAVIAVAGPVTDGFIDLTNSSWTLSEAGLVEAGLGRARLINDYAALALAIGRLGEADLRRIGPEGSPDPQGTLAILGPGTGFGVSALARDGRGGEAALATEGGHVGLAPGDATELEILRDLTERYGRVSVERVLSGPGLEDLHRCLHGEELDAPAITRSALAGDTEALATVDRFCALLGSVAGDFALAYGATGGVYVAGGIAPRILAVLERSPFRERFEAKGRFRDYMAAIPTHVVVHSHPALLGAARALEELVR